MRKLVVSAAVCAAMMGAALAQIEASSAVYFLDVDPARYAGPASQRVAVRLGDQPRHVQISDQDEICVQLQRASQDSDVIAARVRVLKPEPHEPAVVPVVGPNISPGTFRSTPWGMLLRVVPSKAEGQDLIKPLGTGDAPVCTI